MKGELLILYADHPPERRQYTGPIPGGVLNELIDGPLAPVPYFDHIVTWDGVPTKAVAFVNEEAYIFNLPENFWANAIWQYILRSKGEKRVPQPLRGTVVIVTGDEDFMEEL